MNFGGCAGSVVDRYATLVWGQIFFRVGCGFRAMALDG